MRRNALGAVKSMSGTHAGLWLDKFLGDPGEAEEKKEKKALFEGARSCGVPEGYADAFKRWRDGLEADAEAGRMTICKATVQGRMIVGLGAKGPAEAGIRLDRTWGTPMIPGSSLKGLAAAAAHRLTGSDAWQKPPKGAPRKPDAFRDFDWLFGSTDHQGGVVFHDAWWMPEGDKLPLDLDVMTVHHKEYYGGKNAPPSDMDSPVPVYFLTSKGSYLVALEGEPAWCRAAFDLLKFGLAELGIGAKTAAGYGRATLEEQVSDEEKARRAAEADTKRQRELAEAEAKRRRTQAAEALTDVGRGFRGEAQLCEGIAQRLLALKAGLGDEAVLERAKELFAGQHRKVWKNWLEKPNRTEEQRWLSQALEPAS